MTSSSRKASPKPHKTAKKGGSGSNEGSRATDAELAAYIRDSSVAMARMADGRDLQFLSYLLEMVVEEAARLAALEQK